VFELTELPSSLCDIVFFLCPPKQALNLKKNNKQALLLQQQTKKTGVLNLLKAEESYTLIFLRLKNLIL